MTARKTKNRDALAVVIFLLALQLQHSTQAQEAVLEQALSRIVYLLRQTAA